MVELKKMKQLALLVNTMLIGCMLLGFFSFRFNGITYMFYHCIPTLVILISLYFLIRKGLLAIYVGFVYVVLGVYMGAATLCMGYASGFHLYCMSLIPLAFYMEYMSFKMETKAMPALPASLVLIAINFATTGYAVLKGPVYDVDASVAVTFMYVNALIVFGFLVSYGVLMRNLIMDSERKLLNMAHTDRLTGLFNRHYMTSHLNALYQGVSSGQWLAMADIDDFKKINDTLGHNCGDYVLVELTRLMTEVCQGCTISRWGGEEFLIISDAAPVQPELMETLRRRVEQNTFRYEGKDIPVTITIGVAPYRPEQSLTKWIQSADAKLYEGKVNAKNRVVY